MATKNSESLVLLGKQNGLTVIPVETPLTRLNYFDGKFLRAADLKAEQNYLRRLVQLSNEADGPGVAHGFDLTLGGSDTLLVGPGLAIDPAGRVLLLTDSASLSIQQLIEQSRNQDLVSTSQAKAAAGDDKFDHCEVAGATPPTNVQQPGDLYLITVAHAEGYCGEEDVYGKLCEEACVTSTDRPFIVEGLVIRALPLLLETLTAKSNAVALTQAHRRSLVASAYFNDERRRVASLISGPGLKSDVWCFGAAGASGAEVPLGVIARAGLSTLFLDVWTARRERIDSPARRYWQWRMRMRPWDVYLAHILQFQCQLRDVFKTTPTPGGQDPCADARQLVAEASDILAEITKFYETVSGRLTEFADKSPGGEIVLFKGGAAGLNAFQQKLQVAKEAYLLAPSNRLLIQGGIVELPSAGYLPVAPGPALSINEQVRSMMGEGVHLRFCVVRPDYVAHALEAAQHMERISLLEGLDDPQKMPEVDILVPDGEIVDEKKAIASGGYEAMLALLPRLVDNIFFDILPSPPPGVTLPPDLKITVPFNGAARSEVLAGGGRSVRVAMLLNDEQLRGVQSFFTGREPALVEPFGVNRKLEDEEEGASKKDASKKGASKKGASNKEADESGATPQTKRLFARMMSAAVRMSRGQPTMRAGGSADKSVDDTASMSATPIEESLFEVELPRFATRPGRATTPSPVEAGVWLTMNCDHDLSKLKPGQVLHVAGRAVIAGTATIFGSISAYLDAHLLADVRINDAGTSAGKKFIKCQVEAFGSITVKFGDHKETDCAPANFDADISWGQPDSGVGSGIEIMVNDPESKGSARFGAQWGGQPRKVVALASTIHDENGPKETGIVVSNFLSNPDVLNPDNENHLRALKALQVIGTALKTPAFVDMASAQLFPPPAAPTGELTVRGTQDWVLFHRRRTKQCEAEQAVAQPAPNRRYQVYHARLEDVGLLQTLREALKNNDQVQLKRFELKPVTVVEFGANVAQLASNPQSVKTDWLAANPGNHLVYAAVASQSGVEGGSALATQRLQRAEDAVASVSPADAQTVAETLPSVPTSLATAGTDGVIVLITHQEIQQVCHTAFRINENQIQEVLKMISAGGTDAAIKQVTPPPVPLGNVLFKHGTSGAEVISDSLKAVVEEWGKKGGGASKHAIVTFQAGDPPGTDGRIKNEAQFIQIALGGKAELQEFTFIPTQLPQGCPAVSFFAAASLPPPPPPVIQNTCLTVVRVLNRDNLPFIKKEISAGNTNVINTAMGGEFGPVLGNVTFKKGITEVLNNSLTPLKDHFDKPDVGDVLDTLVVARLDATAADKSAFQKQTEFLRQTFGGVQTTPPELLTATLPAAVTCPALVFMVAASFKP